MKKAQKIGIALIVVASAAISVLGLAPSAGAETTTLGVPLPASKINLYEGPKETTTVATIRAPIQADIPRATYTGTITHWRIEGGTPDGAYSIEVLRKEGENTYTETGASQPATPTSEGLQVFETSLPINEGEYVALVIPKGAGYATVDLHSDFIAFTGPLNFGQSVTPSGGTAEEQFAYDVDIERPEPVLTPPAPTPVPAPTPTPAPAGPAQAAAPAPAPVAAPVCKVPKLGGRSLAAAKKALLAADCKVGTVTKDPKAGKDPKVKGSQPGTGSTRPAGTKVKLKLG